MSPSPYLIKVTLKKTPQLIWRRFVVPSDIRLDRLHEVLQTVMGWTEPRAHAFFQKKQGFHPPGQIPEGGLPEKKYTLANLVVRSGGKLKYTHDPAEEKWNHEVVVEDIRFSDPAGANRAFGVDGPRHIAIERSKPKKQVAAKQSDPFYRLGQKLKMLAQSDVE